MANLSTEKTNSVQVLNMEDGKAFAIKTLEDALESPFIEPSKACYLVRGYINQYGELNIDLVKKTLEKFKARV